jgi:nucleoside 2-deoxyribosyltransferase
VEVTRRKVVVVMPFGSGVERRRAILNFSRLKYIIENKCQVVPPVSSAAGLRVDYDVAVARTAMDEIPKKALERIRSADIVIALLSERNQAVAYELGYRRARERTVILMVDSKNVDSKDDVRPVYEKEVAFQDWRQDDVLKQIESIAGSDFPPLADFEVNIPDALKAAIDARDDGLVMGLQLALQEIEQDFGVWFPDPVQKLRGILSDEITRLYPFSVVEVSFSKQGEFEDPNAPATVVDFDDGFSRLYGYAGIIVAKQDTPHTLDRLLNRIAQFSDKDDWDKFLEEQKTLTESVIKRYEPARATVPIRINSSHRDAGFKSKSFLPCMTAYVIDGKISGPHRMYLLIAYIEVPNETGDLSKWGGG